MSLPRRSRSWSPGLSTSNTNGRQRGRQGYCNICKNDLGQIRLGTRRSFSGLVGQTQARCEIAGNPGVKPSVTHPLSPRVYRCLRLYSGAAIWGGSAANIGKPLATRDELPKVSLLD